MCIISCATPLQMSVQGNESLFRSHKIAVVMTFEDVSQPVGKTDEERQAYKDTLALVCRTFTDGIVKEVQRYRLYSSVVKDLQTPSDSAIIISGAIRKYDKGNVSLRNLIGLGAGSSYFHATINFTDSKSGKIIGTISNNGTSWVGGGVIAASQTVEVLMQEAANHVASELWRIKNN